MKIIINRDNFGDIGTAVFYKFIKYIPENEVPIEEVEKVIDSFRSDNIKYKGNRSFINNLDFSEYDFSYIVNKFKFNDNFLIKFLDTNSKNLIGKKLDDLEIIEKSLFPTIVNKEETDSFDYFGSTIISNQTFIMLESLPGYWKVELYEDVVESNNTTGGFIDSEILDYIGEEKLNSPAMTIILGPENNVKNNSIDKYFPNDPMIEDKNDNDLMDISEYKNLEEEVLLNKMISILISMDNSINDINLSYKSWVDSKNPNRNMNKYIIRNDEYYSSKDSINIIENNKDTDFWFDKNSGTIVGNNIYQIENCPILSSKINKIDKTKYSPFIRYNKGDIVYFDGKKWESLSNNNYHNNPYFSSQWIISDKITNIFTPKVSILINPLNSGYTNPGGSITVNTSVRKTFRVIEKLGYVLDENNPCSDGAGNYLTGTEYSLSTNINPSGEIIKNITILNWNKPIESQRLVFNFKETGCFFNFNALDDGVLVPYGNWKNYFNESNFEINGLIVSGEHTIPRPDKDGYITVNPEDSIEIIFNELNKYSISKVISNYILNNVPQKKEIIPEIDDSGNTIIKDIVNYSSTTYTLELTDKILTILVNSFSGFEISKVIDRLIYGDDYLLNFYELDGNIFDHVNIKVNGKDEQQINISSSDINKDINFLGTTVRLELNNTTKIYSLSLKNITFSYKIEIL